MRSSYKKIGNYIHKVDNRNSDLKVTKLLGLSMTKEFRESTSNIVGTDMSTYKIVSKWQFACDFMSVIRVNKLPVALKYDDEPILVSPAYPVFEVNDPNELDPEYLMMWFRRPEFDRYAFFKCDSAIRGGYDWDELCLTEIPIIHITKQRKIVNDYNTIVNKIDINKQFIQRLEELAKTLYKEWFIDFEFPDENGNPYKSNGGKMEFNKELDQEIPFGWEVKPFTKAIKLGGGGTPDTTNNSYWNGPLPFFTPADVSDSYYCVKTEKNITELGLQKSSTKLYPANTTFVTARGTVGAISLAGSQMTMNQSCYAVTGENSFYIHQMTIDVVNRLKKEAIGAVFGALVTKDFDSQFVAEAKPEVSNRFQKGVSPIYEMILLKEKQNHQLQKLQGLLLSKLATLDE